MKSKIYTKTGDAGMTSLVGGKRLRKDDIRIEAYGNIDELNAYLGLLAISMKMEYPHTYATLRTIQNKLFNIGSYLANDDPQAKPYGLAEQDVELIEQEIDRLDSEIPPLDNFILPGSSQLSALSHICRTITRRCERRIVSLGETAPIDPIVVKYINRLSDFFFNFARFNNIHKQIPENFWDKEC